MRIYPAVQGCWRVYSKVLIRKILNPTYYIILHMAKERPAWFWALTLILIMSWALGGTQAVFYIVEGEIILGEIVIIVTTIILVLVYYVIDWLITRK